MVKSRRFRVLIFHDSPLFPVRCGAARRVEQLIKMYSSFSEVINIICSRKWHLNEEFFRKYNVIFLPEAQFYDKKFVKKLIETLQPKLVEANWPEYVSFLSDLGSSAKVIFDAHNADYVLLNRLGRKKTSIRRKPIEREALLKANLTICTSTNDLHALKAIAPSAKIKVVTNCVDLPKRGKTGNHILFVGHGHYEPNQEAVVFLRQLARKMSDLKFRVVGDYPEKYRHDAPLNLSFSGPVSEVALAKEYSNARLTLAPISRGSGTRYKIIESLAFGIPVVSTRLGAEGLSATPSATIVPLSKFPSAIRRRLKSKVSFRTKSIHFVYKNHYWKTQSKVLYNEVSPLLGSNA